MPIPTAGPSISRTAGRRGEADPQRRAPGRVRIHPELFGRPRYAGVKPINFDFKDKLAPRLGAVYDVLGDASLKVFANYAIYYDVMKLYWASGAFGGYHQKTAYYAMDTYEWSTIGINGNYPGSLLLLYDWAPVNLDVADPNLKPMSQREISFGAEKKLMENFSATVRVIQKHLRYAIEDVGVLEPDGTMTYYYANPGYGYSLSTTNGGKFDPLYPECQKAKREYWAVNFSLDKRFARNWLAGFSYTWSRLTGNYSGLASSDEWYSAYEGRNGPNVEINFDQLVHVLREEPRPHLRPLGHGPASLFQALRRLYVPLPPDNRDGHQRHERRPDDRVLARQWRPGHAL